MTRNLVQSSTLERFVKMFEQHTFNPHDLEKTELYSAEALRARIKDGEWTRDLDATTQLITDITTRLVRYNTDTHSGNHFMQIMGDLQILLGLDNNDPNRRLEDKAFCWREVMFSSGDRKAAIIHPNTAEMHERVDSIIVHFAAAQAAPADHPYVITSQILPCDIVHMHVDAALVGDISAEETIDSRVAYVDKSTGLVYGNASGDMKGAIAAFCLSFEHCKRAGNVNFMAIVTPDEEVFGEKGGEQLLSCAEVQPPYIQFELEPQGNISGSVSPEIPFSRPISYTLMPGSSSRPDVFSQISAELKDQLGPDFKPHLSLHEDHLVASYLLKPLYETDDQMLRRVGIITRVLEKYLNLKPDVDKTGRETYASPAHVYQSSGYFSLLGESELQQLELIIKQQEVFGLSQLEIDNNPAISVLTTSRQVLRNGRISQILHNFAHASAGAGRPRVVNIGFQEAGAGRHHLNEAFHPHQGAILAYNLAALLGRELKNA